MQRASLRLTRKQSQKPSRNLSSVYGRRNYKATARGKPSLTKKKPRQQQLQADDSFKSRQACVKDKTLAAPNRRECSHGKVIRIKITVPVIHGAVVGPAVRHSPTLQHCSILQVGGASPGPVPDTSAEVRKIEYGTAPARQTCAAH